MRRLRVPASIRKQLADLRDPQGKARAGIMIVPQMLSIEEWQTQAVPHQQRLIAEARSDMHGWSGPVVNDNHSAAPSLDDVTDRYQPSIPTPVDTTPLETKVQDARQRYEKNVAARRMRTLR